MSKACFECFPLVDAQSHDWDYPVTKLRTEANIEKMRCAEAKLDLLWTSIEVMIKKNTSFSILGLMSSYIPASRELARTPEWIPELIEQPRNNTCHVLTERDLNVAHFRGSTQNGRAVGPKTAINSKAKIKTRGTPKTPTTSAAAILNEVRSAKPEATLDKSIRQKIKVPKRAHKVLSALLPESKSANHQRIEIAWTELLQAMDTIGLEPEKLYGSVWMFKPKSAAECLVDVKRSIQFHEPSVVRKGQKIPSCMVRVFGRRLKHAFGWEDGMFVCE